MTDTDKTLGELRAKMYAAGVVCNDAWDAYGAASDAAQDDAYYAFYRKACDAYDKALHAYYKAEDAYYKAEDAYRKAQENSNA